MTKTIEIKGWIWAKPDAFGEKVTYEFSDYDYEAAVKRGTAAQSWSAYKKVAEHTVIAEIPDDIDPVALMVSALQAEEAALRDQFTRRVNEIRDRLATLQALPLTSTEVLA